MYVEKVKMYKNGMFGIYNYVWEVGRKLIKIAGYECFFLLVIVYYFHFIKFFNDLNILLEVHFTQRIMTIFFKP